MQPTKQILLTSQSINTLRELCAFGLAALSQRRDYNLDRAKIMNAQTALGEPSFLEDTTAVELPALTKQRRAWLEAAVRHGFISTPAKSCSINEQDPEDDELPPGPLVCKTMD